MTKSKDLNTGNRQDNIMGNIIGHPQGAPLRVANQNEIHHRRSIRLKEYDYSQAGFYYITICTQNHKSLFGKFENGKLILNDAGRMVENEWLKLLLRFSNIELHQYTIMPNHFHGIIEISVGAPLVGAMINAPNNNQNINTNVFHDNIIIGHQGQNIEQQYNWAPTRGAPTVGDIVGAFKSRTTVEYIYGVKQNGWIPFAGKLWQRNYYEHIVRDENSYLKIAEYIVNNPLNWKTDEYYEK